MKFNGNENGSRAKVQEKYSQERTTIHGRKFQAHFSKLISSFNRRKLTLNSVLFTFNRTVRLLRSGILNTYSFTTLANRTVTLKIPIA